MFERGNRVSAFLEAFFGKLEKNLYVTWATQGLSIAGFGFVFPFLPYFVQEVWVTDPEEFNRFNERAVGNIFDRVKQ